MLFISVVIKEKVSHESETTSSSFRICFVVATYAERLALAYLTAHASVTSRMNLQKVGCGSREGPPSCTPSACCFIMRASTSPQSTPSHSLSAPPAGPFRGELRCIVCPKKLCTADQHVTATTTATTTYNSATLCAITPFCSNSQLIKIRLFKTNTFHSQSGNGSSPRFIPFFFWNQFDFDR